jgi:fatty-acyl-CoA synthase
MQSVYELLQEARKLNDKPAIICGDRIFTYQELLEQSCRLAEGLRRRVEPGERIAMWVANSLDWIIINLAAGLAGAVVVPLNMRYKSHEISYILKKSKSKMMIFQPELEKYNYLEIVKELLEQEKFPHLKWIVSTENVDDESKFPAPTRLVDLYDDWNGDLTSFLDLSKPDSPFGMLFTSGTTSNPKGVMLSQRTCIYHSYNAGEYLNVSDQDVFLGALPFCGVFGFNTLFAALTHGASIIPMDRYKPSEALESIEKHQVSVFNGVDGMFLPFFENMALQKKYSSVRVGCLALFTAPSRQFIHNNAKVFPNMAVVQPYGMTEVGSMVFIGDPRASIEDRSLAGGYPVSPEIEIEMIDPETEEVLPHEKEGEITIRGYNVMKEYFEDIEKTVESFTRDGRFRTGDIGIKYNNGIIHYKGRYKEALRLKGFLVSPREIEDYITKLSQVEVAQVIGIVANHEEIPIAFIKLKEGETLEPMDIMIHCREGLADYKCPKQVKIIGQFPTTAGSNGEKIQKNKLKEIAMQHFSNS